MASNLEREDEMFEELAVAVERGDAEAGRAVLALMLACGLRTGAILRARRKVRPLPPSAPLARPLVLPIPGAKPGEFGLRA